MEKDNVLGGFEAVFSNIVGEPAGMPSKTDSDLDDDPIKKLAQRNDPIVEPPEGSEDEEEEFEEEQEEQEEQEEEFEEEEEEEEEQEEEEEEEEDPKPKSKKSTKNPKKEDSGVGEYEADIAEYMQEKIFERFGFDIGDNKFESAEDIADFVEAMIEENSSPEYANEDVQAIDEYVRKGGDLRKYMDTVYGGMDLEKIDVENESHQRRLVEMDLKNKGYSEKRIQRALDRYEDAGTLAEEAEDALESLKEYQAGVSDKLLQEQENERATRIEKQQKYVKSVQDAILKLDNIRNIKITEQEKKELINYALKPGRDGLTQYQKDYVKSNQNFIESAFLSMKGDKLLSKVQKQANSSAAKRLQAKLASKGRRGKDQTSRKNTPSTDVWSTVSKQLTRNPLN